MKKAIKEIVKDGYVFSLRYHMTLDDDEIFIAKITSSNKEIFVAEPLMLDEITNAKLKQMKVSLDRILHEIYD